MENKKIPFREKIARKYNTDMPYPMQRGKFLFAFLLCVPAVLGLCVWYFGVNAQSIAMAFQDPQTDAWSLVNFERLLNELSRPESEIYISLINTFKYFIMGAVVIPVTTYFISYSLSLKEKKNTKVTNAPFLL